MALMGFRAVRRSRTRHPVVMRKVGFSDHGGGNRSMISPRFWERIEQNARSITHRRPRIDEGITARRRTSGGPPVQSPAAASWAAPDPSIGAAHQPPNHWNLDAQKSGSDLGRQPKTASGLVEASAARSIRSVASQVFATGG